MIISDIFSNYNMNLNYENNSLNEEDSHRHLGVILSLNNKWTKYIDSIIETSSR